MIFLATKLLLVPLLIAAITVAGQRLGPRMAGALTGLPVVAGPVALFLALEQGPSFAARAAVATLAGEASLGVFCVLYAGSAMRGPWGASVVVGWLGFALATLVLQSFAIPLPAALALALATPIAIRAATPRPVLPLRGGTVSRAEMVLRMAAGAAMVAALTGIAELLGPRLSGLLTVFPIAASVLAVFSHRSLGAAFAVHLLRGLAAGLFSLTAFFLALALLLERAGTTWAFAAAVLASVAVQLVVLRTLDRRRHRASDVR